MNQLFKDNDLVIFDKQIDIIKDKLIKNRNLHLEPTLARLKIVERILFDYVKDKKRKLYGGLAQHMLIIDKQKGKGFYDLENTIADIDFYTPDPIYDAITICNILIDSGFDQVSSTEAVHKGTYTIFVDYEKVCDLSYMPNNIYNRIPFTIIDNINLCSAHFMLIDMYRGFSDPLNSGLLRWEKTFPRVQLLQKYYPINIATKKIPVPYANSKNVDVILNYIKGVTSCILYGNYCYNYYIYYVKEAISKNNKNNKSNRNINIDNRIFDYLPITYLDIISNNYVTDSKNIFNEIKKAFGNDKKVTIKEFQKFSSFSSYSCVIYIDNDVPICKIIDYGKFCGPVKTVPYIDFNNNNKIETIPMSKELLQVAAFDYNLNLCLTSAFYYRVNQNENYYSYYNIMVSHIVTLKNYYFESSGKNMFDDTIFEEFITNCIGYTVSTMREARLSKSKKKAKGKMITWRYSPAESRKETHNYNYPNVSGNEILGAKKHINISDNNISDNNISDDNVNNNNNDSISNGDN